MQLSADVRTGAEVGAAVSLHNITKREASYGDENVNVVLAQAGYSSSSALESPCAPHRVLNHYLTRGSRARGQQSTLFSALGKKKETQYAQQPPTYTGRPLKFGGRGWSFAHRALYVYGAK